jgi:hypothetical protein
MTIPSNLDLTTPKGWQCPKCGKVWAPSIPCCDCHKLVNAAETRIDWAPSPSTTSSLSIGRNIHLQSDLGNK